MIIDSHCHIDFEDFKNDRDKVIEDAKQSGIEHIIVPSITQKSWSHLKEVCAQYNILHPAYGLHPYFLEQHQTEHLEDLKQWLHKNKAIAIGECGLDFFLKNLDKNKQIDIFESQIDIAIEHNLPIIIHSRKATEQVIQIIKKKNIHQGMIHSYSGSLEQATQLIDLGFYISFGGAITYDAATRIRKIAQKIPLDALLIETDSPDQPDAKYHGQRNQPSYICNVIKTFAELRETSIDKIEEMTSQNACRLFRIA
jgi:TatD DNase family protein